MLQKATEKARYLWVEAYQSHVYQVTSAHGNNYEIYLNGEETKCSCAYMQLRRVPCSHVLTVCSQTYANIHTASLVDRHFQSSAYREAYTSVFHPIPDKRYWPERVSLYMLPPTEIRKYCRPKSTRIRNEMDENSGRRVRCRICKELGHNRSTCPSR